MEDQKNLSEWLTYVSESLDGNTGIATRVDLLERMAGIESNEILSNALRALCDHDDAPSDIVAMALVGGVMMLRCGTEKDLSETLSEFSATVSGDGLALVQAAAILNNEDLGDAEYIQ